MKKIIFSLITVLLVLGVMTSCNGQPKVTEPAVEEEPRDLVEVTIAMTESKTLASEINKDIKYWEFKATPKFTLAEDEKIYGTVSYWRMLNALDTGADGVVKTETSLGRYTSGDWYFQVRALNSNKRVVAVGSKQQILREGVDNTVNITMLVDRADGTEGESRDRDSAKTGWDGHAEISALKETTVEKGTLHVGLVVNRMDNDLTKMRIRTIYQKVEKNTKLAATTEVNSINWDDRNGAIEGTINPDGTTATNPTAGEYYTLWYKESTPLSYDIKGDSDVEVETGKVYYEGVLSDLDAGPYIFTFFLEGRNQDDTDWVILGGQALDVVIVGGEETQVKGTLLANEYVLAGLVITAPGTIYGSINGQNFIKGTTDTPIKLEFQQTEDEIRDSGEEPTMWYWYVDGDKVKDNAGNLITTKSMEFSCPKDANDNPIYGIYRVSCSPVGPQGSIGTTTVDIIFDPPTSEANYGEFDWSNVFGV